MPDNNGRLNLDETIIKKMTSNQPLRTQKIAECSGNSIRRSETGRYVANERDVGDQIYPGDPEDDTDWSGTQSRMIIRMIRLISYDG